MWAAPQGVCREQGARAVCCLRDARPNRSELLARFFRQDAVAALRLRRFRGFAHVWHWSELLLRALFRRFSDDVLRCRNFCGKRFEPPPFSHSTQPFFRIYRRFPLLLSPSPLSPFPLFRRICASLCFRISPCGISANRTTTQKIPAKHKLNS